MSARSHTCTASVRCMTLFARTQYEKQIDQLLGYYVINFLVQKYYCKYFCRPATPIHGLNLAPLNLITTTLNQSTSAQPPPPHSRLHQPGQLVYDLNPHPASDSRARGPGFDTRSGHILSFIHPPIQERQLSVTGESMCMKYRLTA